VLLLTSFLPNFTVAYASDSNYKEDKKNEKKIEKVEKAEEKKETTEIIVKYKDNAQAIISFEGQEVEVSEDYGDIKVLKLQEEQDMTTALDELRENKNVELAQPNYKLFTNSLEPEYKNQWALENVGQTVAKVSGVAGEDIKYKEILGGNAGEGILIGILDTGIDINHEDLKDNIYVNVNEVPNNGIDDDGNGYIDDVNGFDFYNEDNTVFDSPSIDAHGTHVAGIIGAAANGKGVVGVAPSVKIVPLKFLNGKEGYTSDAIKAIKYAERLGVKIINCSFGGDEKNIALKEAMEASDILFVAGAGNSGTDSEMRPQYPASFELPNVISVASMDSKGNVSGFSNYGSRIDVVAPGSNIISTAPGNNYDYKDGTSQAAAQVTGIAALVKNKYRDMTATELAERIKITARKSEKVALKTPKAGVADAKTALEGIVSLAPVATVNADSENRVNDQKEETQADSKVNAFAATIAPSLLEAIYFGEDGVNVATGNYSRGFTDFSVDAPGFEVKFSRTYNSKDNRENPIMGKGWTFGFEGSLKTDTNDTSLRIIKLPNGSAELFKLVDNNYIPQDTRSSLVKNSDESHVLTTKDHYKYGFNKDGQLVWMSDREGNQLLITRDGNKVTSVKDTVGREYTMTYSAEGLLTKVTLPSIDGKVIDIDYEYGFELAGKKQLTKVTDPMGNTIDYSYDTQGYLSQIKLNWSVVLEELTYDHTTDGQHRVKTYKDEFGKISTYIYETNKTTAVDQNNRKIIKEYDQWFSIIKVTDPEGNVVNIKYYIYDNINVHNEEESVIDRYGNETKYIRNKDTGNIESIINPDGGKRKYVYDDYNNLIEELDEDGLRTFYIYDSSKSKLLKEVKALYGDDYNTAKDLSRFSIKEYEYYQPYEDAQLGHKAKGLLKSETDGEGRKTSYQYDQYGNKTAITNPLGGVSLFKYNELGWLSEKITPNGITTVFEHDKGGNVVRIIENGKVITRKEFDNEGRKTLEVLPNHYDSSKDELVTATDKYGYNEGYSDPVRKYTYYSNGLLKTSSEDIGISYEYDEYGNKTKETRPNSSYYLFEYDEMNRLSKTFFVSSLSSTRIPLKEYSYEDGKNGTYIEKETTFISKKDGTDVYVANTITKELNFRGDVVSFAKSSGATSKIIYNKNGTVNHEIGFNGGKTYYMYDGLGRLVETWKQIDQGEYSYAKVTYNKAGEIIEDATSRDKVALHVRPADDRLVKKTKVYDLNGNIIEQSNSAGSKKRYEFNLDNQLTAEYVYQTEDKVQKTTYEVDYAGRITKKSVQVDYNDLFERANQHNPMSTIDTIYEYDLNGNLVKEYLPNNMIIERVYDKKDREIETREYHQKEFDQIRDEMINVDHLDTSVLKKNLAPVRNNDRTTGWVTNEGLTLVNGYFNETNNTSYQPYFEVEVEGNTDYTIDLEGYTNVLSQSSCVEISELTSEDVQRATYKMELKLTSSHEQLKITTKADTKKIRVYGIAQNSHIYYKDIVIQKGDFTATPQRYFTGEMYGSTTTTYKENLSPVKNNILSTGWASNNGLSILNEYFTIGHDTSGSAHYYIPVEPNQTYTVDLTGYTTLVQNNSQIVFSERNGSDVEVDAEIIRLKSSPTHEQVTFTTNADTEKVRVYGIAHNSYIYFKDIVIQKGDLTGMPQKYFEGAVYENDKAFDAKPNDLVVEGRSYENLVKGASFRDKDRNTIPDDWYINPTYSFANSQYISSTESVKMTVNGSVDMNIFAQDDRLDGEAKDKYYMSAMVKTNIADDLRVVIGNKEPGYGRKNASGSQSWELISGIGDKHNSDGVALYVYNAPTHNGKFVEVGNVSLVNLTKTFGAGNEPNLKWCDDNLSYLESGINILDNHAIKIRSAQLFDKRKMTKGKYVAIGGTVYSDANFAMTNKIEIDPAKHYELTGVTANVTAGKTVIAYYNANQEYMGYQFHGNDGSEEVNIPQGARYLTFSLGVADEHTAVLKTVTSNLSYAKAEKQLFDSSQDVEEFEKLINVGGVDIVPLPGCFYTKYKSVQAGRTIQMTGNYEVHRIMFYDANKVFISESQAFPYKVPANAIYMRINGTTANMRDLSVYYYDNGSAAAEYDEKIIDLDGISLNSLPGGIADTLYVNEGKLVRRVKSLKLKDANLDEWYTDFANVNVYTTEIFTDGEFDLNNRNNLVVSGWNFVQHPTEGKVGTYYLSADESAKNKIHFMFPKTTTKSDARSQLMNVLVQYKLGVEQVNYVTPHNVDISYNHMVSAVGFAKRLGIPFSGTATISIPQDTKLIDVKGVYEYSDSNLKTRSLNYTVSGNKVYGLWGVSRCLIEFEYDKPVPNPEFRIESKTSMVSTYDNGLGVKTSRTYDSLGNVISSTDKVGNITKFVYDDRGNLLRKVKTVKASKLNGTDDKEIVYAYEYNNIGKVTRSVMPTDFDTALYNYYDGNTDKLNRTEYVYDEEGNEIFNKRVYKQNGTWLYDIISVKQYDEAGNMIKEVSGENYNLDVNAAYGTEYKYNYFGLVTEIRTPDSKAKNLLFTVRNEYDGLGREVAVINADGTVENKYYDDNSNLKEITKRKSIHEPEVSILKNIYDLNGNIIEKIDGNGIKTKYEYNSFGMLNATILARDQSIPEDVVLFKYDVMGNVKSTESKSLIVEYIYDEYNRKIKTKKISKNTGKIIEATKLYDILGNIKFEQDANGNLTEHFYDNIGRKIKTEIKVTDLNGRTTARETVWKYNDNSKVLSMSDWRGNTVKNEYDTFGRLVKVIGPDGTVLETKEYNLNDAEIVNIDAKFNKKQYLYNLDGRLVATIDPMGNKTSTEYDAQGRTVAEVDENGNRTEYAYNFLGRLKTVTNAIDEKTTYTYDKNGNLTTLVDANGHETIMEYNARNKLVRRVDNGGRTSVDGKYEYDSKKTVTYSYYENGSVKEMLDRNGVVTKYTYDDFGRLLRTEAGDEVIVNTYDNNGNKLTMTDTTGTTIRSYDEFNRVTVKTVPNVGSTIFEYDLTVVKTGATEALLSEGQYAQRTTDPKGNVSIKIYDENGRLFKVADGDDSIADVTTYDYEANGNRKSITYSNGVKEEYSYDSNNKLQILTNKSASGAVIDKYEYRYDKAGNMVEKTETIAEGIRKTEYKYDGLGRLIEVKEPSTMKSTTIDKTTSYLYDKAGNRIAEHILLKGVLTSKIYKYNEQNRLMEIVSGEIITDITTTVKFKYDNNGNQLYTMTEVVKPITANTKTTFGMFISGQSVDGSVNTDLSGSTTINTYNEFNQLIKTTTGGVTVENTYNGEGQRTFKKVNGEITQYVYVADKVVLELDGLGKEKARNHIGLNLISRRVDGVVYNYLYNGHSDVVALLNVDGTVAMSYYYDAFGVVIKSEPGPGQSARINNTFGYGGYQYDSETKMYYLNARMYDPVTARFLQEDTYRGTVNDPLSLNLYTYCSNNPVIYLDPTGHKRAEVQAEIDAITRQMADNKAKWQAEVDAGRGTNTKWNTVQSLANKNNNTLRDRLVALVKASDASQEVKDIASAIQKSGGTERTTIDDKPVTINTVRSKSGLDNIKDLHKVITSPDEANYTKAPDTGEMIRTENKGIDLGVPKKPQPVKSTNDVKEEKKEEKENTNFTYDGYGKIIGNVGQTYQDRRESMEEKGVWETGSYEDEFGLGGGNENVNIGAGVLRIGQHDVGYHGDISVVDAYLHPHVGDDDSWFSLGAELSGGVANAEAAAFGDVSNGVAFLPGAKGELGGVASLIEGEASGYIKIGKLKINLTVEGEVAAAGAEIGGQFLYREDNVLNVLAFNIGAALGLGGEVEASIQWVD